MILNNDSNPSSNADSDNILNPGESGVLNINLANEIKAQYFKIDINQIIKI